MQTCCHLTNGIVGSLLTYGATMATNIRHSSLVACSDAMAAQMSRCGFLAPNVRYFPAQCLNLVASDAEPSAGAATCGGDYDCPYGLVCHDEICIDRFSRCTRHCGHGAACRALSDDQTVCTPVGELAARVGIMCQTFEDCGAEFFCDRGEAESMQDRTGVCRPLSCLRSYWVHPDGEDG